MYRTSDLFHLARRGISEVKKEVNIYDIAGLPVSVKNRNDYADYDYINQLDPKALKWLKGFNREYINADFSHKYTKLFKGKRKKKECYTLNNIRNRCLYNQLKVCHELLFGNEIGEKTNTSQTPHPGVYEDLLIHMLDNDPVPLENKKGKIIKL